MPFSRYAIGDLTRFLVAVDDGLQDAARLVVIGGSALVLGYGGTAATSDIDTYESRSHAINEAAAAARASTGLDIPIMDSGVAQLPAGFEDRLRRVLPQLHKLEVYVLDRHDLAASKLVRGNEHDRQQLAELHALAPLDLETLVDRFRVLMGDFVGDTTEPWWALRFFVEEIWGELEAAAIDAERRPPRR